ncbi:cell growth regulatory protein [Paucilactobacillus hokkaidonensis JCM 18461]|uniref:Cell growth regulatory protein n=2 Tax=Paucilactobacillus hokkaidonensis TaxID=1193095 RepID=A0A0A1GWS4_9LACO|nr:type II toxin-antitoxin system PemK/MazF family toxin [Paucilactobacillus hokkaidonensis]KRO09360.1 hypothetical protein IV59_GL000698 [Paucilactobacillus hokkaidonensis]BAP84866.1 cell growth regulatory protein [Paucilactobacillus hokkaidonensis JCM 18461]
MHDVPEQGSLIYIDAEPHAGHEYGGHNSNMGNIRRPMIVLSNSGYNQKTGMVSGMVITSTRFNNSDNYIEIADFKSGISGSIVTWQLPSYDYSARHGEIVGKINGKTLNMLIQKVVEIYSIF